MLSSAEKNDFNLTDFYHIVADARPMRTLDTDIVLVDIANSEREEITDLLNILSEMRPAAVGLDVVFNEEHADDEALLEAMSRLPNLVMAVGVSEAPGASGAFMVDDYSYFYPSCRGSHKHGVVNFPTKFSGATIRSCRPEFIDAAGDTLPSLSVALANLVDPEAVRRLRSRGNEVELIDYPSRTFASMSLDEVPDNADKIAGKIVLIGSLAEKEDVHATPVSSDMPGVMIHAYAASSILRGATYKVAGRAVNMAIAFVLCFLLCYTNISFKSPARALWMRIAQLAVLYLIIRVGYYMFIDRQVIIDFSYTLLMLTFGFFALDLWTGMAHYAGLLYNKLKNRN
ncbi:MAG: CHASE2 domain-containing protein [Muribaculaceae bacterium]|nr:CHASE2 domain-containing protein [Muribaculaceae bacterium]